jgi:hypothetical protein
MVNRFLPIVQKYPVEVFLEQVDFTDVLNAGESISTADVTAKNARSGADTTTEMISGISIVVGDIIQYTLSGGELDERYIVVASATLNNGQVIAQRVQVNVPALYPAPPA